MKICDKCGKKSVRRLVKVKDVIYGKGFTDFDFCENYFQQIFKPVKDSKNELIKKG